MSRLSITRTCAVAIIALFAVVGVVATPAAGRTVELTPIKVGIIGLEPTGQAMYAKHRAMFRKQGIDAKLTLVADPTQTTALLLSGEVDFAVTHVGNAASLKAKGFPIRIIAAGALYDPKKVNSNLVSAPGKTFTRARDLVGKTIAVDSLVTIAGVGMLKWLKVNGVDRDDVEFVSVPFNQMLGPLTQGKFDAAFMPEPFRTLALEQGAKRIADPFRVVCSKICLLTLWMAPANVDRNLEARFRNAIQKASEWANQDRNDAISGKILTKYTPIDPALVKKMTRTTFGTRLRVSLVQPWLPVLAEYGVIPASFKPIDLVR